MIDEMRKQILAYRQEIIELSTSKRYSKARRELRGGSDTDNMRVPKLDLSKVKHDSEDSNSQNPKNKKQQNVTYQQYLKFLENESRFEEMGEESRESLIRQEELKQRKNKIIQLLNGEISDEEGEGADIIDQSSGGNYEEDVSA